MRAGYFEENKDPKASFISSSILLWLKWLERVQSGVVYEA